MTVKWTRNVYKSLAADCTRDYKFEIWMHNFIISFSPETPSFYICCFPPKKPDLCSRCGSYSGLKWLGISILLSIPMKVCTAWHPHKIQELSCFSSGRFTFGRNSRWAQKDNYFFVFFRLTAMSSTYIYTDILIYIQVDVLFTNLTGTHLQLTEHSCSSYEFNTICLDWI